MLLNFAWFTVNGGDRCGYVLKPQFMYDLHQTFDPIGPCMDAPVMLLEVEVISAQQIPKPKNSKKGEVIDPFVELQLHGIEKDDTKVQATQAVDNNGYNPIWKQTFRFEIRMPELAVLTMQVFDKDMMKKTLICQYAIHVTNIRYGVRVVPMLDTSLEGLPHTCLLCRFHLAPFE